MASKRISGNLNVVKTGYTLALLVVLAAAAPGRIEAQTVGGLNAVCEFYFVRMSGQADGGLGPQAFDTANQMNQFVVLRSPGANGNPVEVLITNFPRSVIGDTTGNLSSGRYPVGHLELMSNSLYANNPGIRSVRMNLAQVDVWQYENPGDVVTFDLISQAAFQQPQPNAVVLPGQGALLGGLAFLSGGLSAFSNLPGATILDTEFLIPFQGSGWLYFPTPDRSLLYGGVQFGAFNNFNLNLRGAYDARITGNLIGQARCE